MEWFAIGNITAAETIQLVRSIQSTMYGTSPLSPWTPGLTFVRSVPCGTSLVRMEVANADCKNCSSQVYWQLPPAMEDRCYLLGTCCKSYIFNDLRTKKQLGYIVWSFHSCIMTECGFTVIVQSNTVGMDISFNPVLITILFYFILFYPNYWQPY